METRTERLWAGQNRHDGDRTRLFGAVAGAIEASSVLYPGSFVDVAASFVFPDVVYVDMDRRAEQFFADTDGVQEIIAANQVDDVERSVRFVASDYQEDLGLEPASFDLLISLYAGFISEHCTEYLRIGGSLLVNPSHGDAAMASIDPRYRLQAVVISARQDYRVVTDDLDRYLQPKRDEPITADRLRELGRGIAYTVPSFAYLFERIA